MFPFPGGQVSEKTSKINKEIDEFLLALRRGRVYGSYDISVKTAAIMLMVIESGEWTNAKGLIDLIKQYGKRLINAKPLELSIVNTIRRVLYIIRDEHKLEQAEEEETTNQEGSTDKVAVLGPQRSVLKTSDGRDTLRASAVVHNPLNQSGMISVLMSSPAGDLSHSSKNLREAIVVTISDYLEELREVGNSIAGQAREHIHAKEIIMTFGKSRTVEHFLKVAARKRTFEVVVVEGSPGDSGQEMALSLASAGIETCLIPDSAAFAIMSRVNKVIVGTHGVMANGGLISVAGTHMIATAAHHFNVPFVVCTGLYKLSPLYAHDQDSYNELKAPAEVLPFSTAQRFNVAVKNPAWDYTPPELVSLYITNGGAYSPTYIYRLLAEYYHPEDMDL